MGTLFRRGTVCREVIPHRRFFFFQWRSASGFLCLNGGFRSRGFPQQKKCQHKPRIHGICRDRHDKGILPTVEKHTQEDTFCQQVDGGEDEAGDDSDEDVGKEILSRLQTIRQ